MNPNTPIFPKVTGIHTGTLEGVHGVDSTDGMTLRAYLAGQALSGWIAAADSVGTAENAATACCEYADALISELNKPKT